jgi:hypothetical protein
MELLINAKEAQGISKRNGGLYSLVDNLKVYITRAADQGLRDTSYSTFGISRNETLKKSRNTLTKRELKIVTGLLTKQGFKFSIKRSRMNTTGLYDVITVKW